jgi:O-antigen ligase
MVAFSGLRLLGPTKGLTYSALFALVLILLVPWAYRNAPERIQERLIVVGPNVNKYTEGRADLTAEQRGMAVELLKENPLFGVGLRGFESRTPIMAHDSVSAILGETGLLGLLSMMWLLSLCMYWLIRAGRRFLRIGYIELYYYSMGFMASVVATLVAGLGGYVFFSSRWFWFALGMAAVIARWSDSMDRDFAAKADRPMPLPMPLPAVGPAVASGFGWGRMNSGGPPTPRASRRPQQAVP